MDFPSFPAVFLSHCVRFVAPESDRLSGPSILSIVFPILRRFGSRLIPLRVASGKAKILPKSTPLLTAVADAFKVEPEIKKVEIQGHTDNRGKASTNMALSNARAQAVRAFLIDHGVEPVRLDAQGYGDAKPVEPNKTSKGRAANRRVEFHIIDPAPGSTTPSAGTDSPAVETTPAEKAPPKAKP